ncbi:MAG TPA: phosphoribosylanthranilate isomerase [Desulfomonilia bacterium]|nr:phosphoribosylanthranilate isomerase [Desulfomonilia bacterium]
MWVKICGITRHDDAVLAVRLGADALGFVFTKSPRKIMRNDVAAWIREVKGVEKVAVFTDEGVEEILKTVESLGIDTIQLHAAPSGEHERLSRLYRIIYAVREYHEGMLPDFPCRILIDTSTGKGMKGLWKERKVPYILAGGLSPENVREAIELAKPAGVDVSSGVELSPGIKDPYKVEKFIREAKS